MNMASSEQKKGGSDGLTYRDAGVDIEAGNDLVDAIKPLAASTRRSGADGALGGFGGLFDLKAAGYSDPILVAATDGVGTKLRVAIDAGQHDTVGIDLVAMCVNDLIVQGAAPLMFLDYYATGKLSVEVARDVIAGIAEGCRQSDAALIGGETAEMPGMYGEGDYDLAGFSVGAAERHELIDGSKIAEGNLLLGLASNGVHSNGYSLIRKIVEKNSLTWQDPAPFDTDMSLGEALLKPTRIYVKPVLKALRNGGMNGLVHVTGGGFYENLPRVMPEGLGCRVNRNTWPQMPVFKWLQEAGNVAAVEMLRTFNCGLGMVLVVDADAAPELTEILTRAGETVYTIGSVRTLEAGMPAVEIEGIDS